MLPSLIICNFKTALKSTIKHFHFLAYQIINIQDQGNYLLHTIEYLLYIYNLMTFYGLRTYFLKLLDQKHHMLLYLLSFLVTYRLVYIIINSLLIKKMFFLTKIHIHLVLFLFDSFIGIKSSGGIVL